MPPQVRGYFDLQVNGYAGVDINGDGLTLPDLERMCDRLAADGVDGILATVITDAVPLMVERIARIARFHAESPRVQRIIHGLHIEGPFLNESEGFVGAHPVKHIKPANLDDAKQFLNVGEGLVRLVTLAPDRDHDLAVTRHLAEQGVTVSAGHCDPSRELLIEAIDAGLSMFTHLGNGCAARVDRHNNIIQRVLSLSDRLWVCFIADGVHVPWFALGNYLRCATLQRCILVTDAMAAAGHGPGEYTIGSVKVSVGTDMVVRRENGYLAGSCTTMQATAENVSNHLHFTADQLQLLLCENPRRAVGLAKEPATPVPAALQQR